MELRVDRDLVQEHLLPLVLQLPEFRSPEESDRDVGLGGEEEDVAFVTEVGPNRRGVARLIEQAAGSRDLRVIASTKPPDVHRQREPRPLLGVLERPVDRRPHRIAYPSGKRPGSPTSLNLGPERGRDTPNTDASSYPGPRPMTSVKTVAAHEVVQATYPRPVTEKDEIGMAAGKAIDETLSRYSYEFSQGRHPTRTAMNRLAAEILDEELADADVQLSPEDRERQLTAISGVLQAFRQSEVMGLARPRSRLVLINGRVGIYAQPDYWDGRARIYEMKSYHATPTPPDVRLQLQLFQLAFPNFRAFLASFDRHATPVTTTIEEIPPLESPAAEEVLRLAFRIASEKGTDKVLEYVDNPTVRYTIIE
jgi:hypothetical protein